jgi:hypothetical protein
MMDLEALQQRGYLRDRMTRILAFAAQEWEPKQRWLLWSIIPAVSGAKNNMP